MAGGVVLVGAAIGATVMLAGGSKTDRPDLVLYTVKYENLDLTVVERGTLESSENRDVTCTVKASKGGNYATTITWVIDDGTVVRQGELILRLDSAALKDQLVAQDITRIQAKVLKIKAKGDLDSVLSENRETELKAENALRGAELDLEKFLGLPRGTMVKLTLAERKEFVADLETSLEGFFPKHKAKFVNPDGEYQSLIDDVNGRIGKAEADAEQWKDRSSYSQRMVIKGYVTQSQAQSDESNLSSASEGLKKVRTEKRLLQTFVAQRTVLNLCSLMKEAEIALEKTRIQNQSKLDQVKTVYNANDEIYKRECRKYEEIEVQIKECDIYSPQDGMVVYYVPDQARWGGGSQQSIVAQGEPVREGQKLMRIPNLEKMQVVARVHEAMISRIKPDVHKQTRFSDTMRAVSILNGSIMPPLYLLEPKTFADFKSQFSDKDVVLAGKGQGSRVRVDAFVDTPLEGHVKSIATVATQDFFTSDVKVYQTVIGIDEPLEGLRPGMSAEVTIKIQNSEQILAIPVEAVIGGPELGDKRKCYVMTSDGPKERDITIGLSNDKMAEVRAGLEEGDQVVHNPKVLLGDKAKTRDADSKTKGKDGKAKGGPGKGGPPK